jgi:hypothetical protein
MGLSKHVLKEQQKHLLHLQGIFMLLLLAIAVDSKTLVAH